jgi:diaminohydroxyphosphoribosylaminopyrimidine deaminase/5-amino-6-(5-phosphoribosylamino)uracil reductase
MDSVGLTKTNPCGEDDIYWMRRALQLAELGRGRVEPNPMVGCVLVKDGHEIGRGYHSVFGGPHAEVEALADCSHADVAQGTLFVTLEPCSHHGKTPPCVDLLIAKRPRRVVVAMVDPFPQVAGRGIAALREAGIQVDTGVLEQESRWLNGPYLKRLRTGLPWVIAKWAMTLDGAIATSTGDSKWITGERAREVVHAIRAQMDAIIVGSETVLCDDPMLTARPNDPGLVPRRMVRVVVDRRFRIPELCHLVQTSQEVPVLIVSSEEALHTHRTKRTRLEHAGVEVVHFPSPMPENLELGWLMKWLADRGATNVMVEGGGRLTGAFFDAGLVDQIDCFIAPRVLGGELGRRPVAGKNRDWMNQAKSLSRTTIEWCGSDVHLRGFLDSE